LKYFLCRTVILNLVGCVIVLGRFSSHVLEEISRDEPMQGFALAECSDVAQSVLLATRESVTWLSVGRPVAENRVSRKNAVFPFFRRMPRFQPVWLKHIQSSTEPTGLQLSKKSLLVNNGSARGVDDDAKFRLGVVRISLFRILRSR
jgi:hypothetical protein